MDDEDRGLYYPIPGTDKCLILEYIWVRPVPPNARVGWSESDGTMQFNRLGVGRT